MYCRDCECFLGLESLDNSSQKCAAIVWSFGGGFVLPEHMVPIAAVHLSHFAPARPFPVLRPLHHHHLWSPACHSKYCSGFYLWLRDSYACPVSLDHGQREIICTSCGTDKTLNAVSQAMELLSSWFHNLFQRDQIDPHPLCGPLLVSTTSTMLGKLFPHP